MTILFLILGASLGSFLGVIIDNKFKVPSLKQRSKCKSCQKTIGLLSLIPILSFLIQRGKCRMCPSQIPRYLFALELANLFLFGLVLSWQYTLAPSLLLFAFVSLNLLMAIFDYKNLSIKTYKSKLIKININRCDYFKNDPITKSFTLFYNVNKNHSTTGFESFSKNTTCIKIH